MSDEPTGSLRELHRQLPLRLCHLAPEFCQICLDGLIIRFLAQSERKPSIGSWKIVRSAQTRRVKRAHLNHGFRISRICRGLQQSHAAIAILRCTLAVEVFPRFGYRIARNHRPRFRRRLCLRFWRRRSISCSVSIRICLGAVGRSFVRRGICSCSAGCLFRRSSSSTGIRWLRAVRRRGRICRWCGPRRR